jgi:hypothetical protein
MRVGFNPNKDQEITTSDYFHQVVVPVYIPNLEGYFKDGLTILKYCLESLLQTSHSKTYFTIVNNGSCIEVIEYLVSLKRNKQIQELIHTTNIGKLNSVLKGLVGHSFPLVTITDADVMFLQGWQQASYTVFDAFPKAAVVGLTPQFKTFESNCGNVIWDYLFSKSMRFQEVKNPQALIRFYESIGWDYNYNKDYLQQALCITQKNCTAIVGTGHFVATYQRQLFEEVISYIPAKMGANSESYLDKAALEKGLYRLTTMDNFAYHLGNVAEDWMQEEANKPLVKPIENVVIPSFDCMDNVSKSSFWLKNKLFGKLFSNRVFRKWWYSYKKLPQEMVATY